MHHAHLVCFCQGAADLHHDLERAFDREPAHAADQVAQVFALEVLHGQVDQAVGGAEVEDLHGVGVRQPAHQLRLAFEARHLLGIARQLAGQQLERHQFSDARVLDAVHHAHAAAADRLFDAVTFGHHHADQRVGQLARVGSAVLQRGRRWFRRRRQ